MANRPGFDIDNAVCIHQTDEAILVEAPIFDDPEWIPQSQINDYSEVWKKGDEGTLVVHDSWAEKKGWI
jgi:hypothetical protein